MKKMSSDSDDMDIHQKLSNIENEICLTRFKIDAKFAGSIHSPLNFVKEHEHLTSKLVELEAQEQQLKQQFVRARLPNQQWTSVPVREGPILDNIVGKTFSSLELCECCRRLLFQGSQCRGCGYKSANGVPTHCYQMSALGKIPLAELADLSLDGPSPINKRRLNPTASAIFNHQIHEMTVPIELYGCVIGIGGTKIATIREISGAMIRTSNYHYRESGVTEHTIYITGNPDAVAIAQNLINLSIELQKANLEAQNSPNAGASSLLLGQCRPFDKR